jgi:hypothetical protein
VIVMNEPTAIELDIAGIGLVFYSPFSAAHFKEGEDYFFGTFDNPAMVAEQAMAGGIFGLNLGSSGTFILELKPGYPDEDTLDQHEFKLRGGVVVRDGTICVRDLYDLMDWTAAVPPQNLIRVPDGFCHMTFLTNVPPSGVVGEDQVIQLYLNPVPEMPALHFAGVPSLC